jgi:hypothetical protein
MKEKLDWISSADFAELDFGFNVAFAFGALNSAVFRVEVLWFAKHFAEVLVVEELLFVLDFNLVCVLDGFLFLGKLLV